MHQRCRDDGHPSFRFYGARGVRVCPRWRRFKHFLADMGERPEGTTLGRFRDTGDYAPGNCCWQTPAQQLAERRRKAA
jgi:hypothetical protein